MTLTTSEVDTYSWKGGWSFLLVTVKCWHEHNQKHILSHWLMFFFQYRGPYQALLVSCQVLLWQDYFLFSHNDLAATAGDNNVIAYLLGFGRSTQAHLRVVMISGCWRRSITNSFPCQRPISFSPLSCLCHKHFLRGARRRDGKAYTVWYCCYLADK